MYPGYSISSIFSALIQTLTTKCQKGFLRKVLFVMLFHNSIHNSKIFCLFRDMNSIFHTFSSNSIGFYIVIFLHKSFSIRVYFLVLLNDILVIFLVSIINITINLIFRVCYHLNRFLTIHPI